MRAPYVAPSKSIIEQIANWAGEKVEQAANSKIGYYVGGAVAVGAVLLYLKTK